MQISKHTKFNYWHTITVMKQFQKEGLIKPIFGNEDAEHKKDPGNPYIVELTPKGQVTTRLLNMLYALHIGNKTDANEMLIKLRGGKNGKKEKK